MGRDFCPRDENGCSIDPERYYLDMSISRHNNFIQSDGGTYTHYNVDSLKRQIEELTNKFEENKNLDVFSIAEAIKVFYVLLAEMSVQQKIDVWIHYN